jgi:hypothetical protein
MVTARRRRSAMRTSKWMSGPLFVLALTLVWAAPVLGQAAKRKAAATPAGQWTGTADTQDGGQPFTMNLKVVKTTVTGELVLDNSPIPITEGSWTKGALKFSFTHPSGDVATVMGSLEGGALVGTYQMAQGGSGGWKAERKK